MKAGSPSLKIGFNAKFLIDAVKSMDEKLVFKYNGLGRPGMFISENRSALIMPMHLG
jgi:DNA polymerase III sliding clamp (beta) subunit (PCNA family)